MIWGGAEESSVPALLVCQIHSALSMAVLCKWTLRTLNHVPTISVEVALSFSIRWAQDAKVTIRQKCNLPLLHTNEIWTMHKSYHGDW